MTNNIKGPESSRRPPPSGQGSEGGAGVSFHQAIDRLLSHRDTAQTRVSARQGEGNDLPSGGAQVSKRQDVMRTFAADHGTRLSESWTGFTAGARSFADLLQQVVSTAPGGSKQSDNRTELASQFRQSFPLSDLLPPPLTGSSPTLSTLSPRSMGPEDSRQITDLTTTLLDSLFGKAGQSSPLPDRLPQSGLNALRQEAQLLLASLPPGDGQAALRSLAQEVLFNHALLPDLLSLAAKPDGPKALGTATLVLHALLSETGMNSLSPDLANSLAPLRSGLESRFDDLLRALRLPGFTE